MNSFITKVKNDKPLQRRINIFIDICLIAAAILSTVKLIILGLTVDEEYAVIMAYRNAIGDGMFKLMWEPHQTSGFICTALIRAFINVTGKTDHLVIFLRICGFCIEALVSVFVYTTFRKNYSRHLAFCASLVSFLILPKWILTPEFSNILIWSSICLMMCIMRIYSGDGNRILWPVLAGVFTCIAILAYPSCILAAPFILIAIHFAGAKTKPSPALITLITCVAFGLAYIGYFLTKMSLSDFVFGIRQMLSDGSHSSATGKVSWILTEAVSWIIPLLIITTVSLLIYIICQKVNKRKGKSSSFALTMLIVSILHQLIYWLIPSNLYFNRPLLYLYIAFITGLIACRDNKSLIRIFFIPNIAIWACVMLVTNTGFRVTGAFLMPCIILSMVILCDEKSFPAARHFMFLMIFILFFARGYLVMENNGYKENAQYVKQKALSGPAEGIYCVYNDGYDYNTAAELLSEYASEGDTILVAGSHSLWYMLGDYKIGTYSTISTPTFDERLFEYYELYPDRRPDLVIGEEGDNGLEAVEKLMGLGKPVESRNGLVIYSLKMV